jgi:hypothetical protein
MLLGLLFIIISCKNNNSEEDIIPNFKSFIYCYSDMRSNNLIKFLGNDTIFLQRRFPEESIGNYYVILDKDDKDWLNNFLNNLNLKTYDAIYKSSGVEDGCSETFIINRANIESGVFIPNRKGPIEFRNLAIWLRNLKNDYFFIATKEEIDFGNPERFYLPPPPPPKISSVCF